MYVYVELCLCVGSLRPSRQDCFTTSMKSLLGHMICGFIHDLEYFTRVVYAHRNRYDQSQMHACTCTDAQARARTHEYAHTHLMNTNTNIRTTRMHAHPHMHTRTHAADRGSDFHNPFDRGFSINCVETVCRPLSQEVSYMRVCM